MSKKQVSSRRNGDESSTDDAVAELERQFRKQQYKDAVKQAKLIYKAQANAENHKLLERAYRLRADQLYRSGMIGSAIEVAGHLLVFGVTDVSLIEEFAALLMKLGMAAEAYRIQGKVESPEAQNRLAEIAADQAVLHPDRSKPDSPQVGLEAARVRQALEALETRDDTKALELVREIARSSPLSEWKLFVRGLAAFYRGDAAEAQANWDRLDADRAPFRIVQRLRSLEAAKPAGAGSGPNLEALESMVFGESILARLRELNSLVSKQQWIDILRRIPSLRASLLRVDPKLAADLTGALIGPLVHEAAERDYESGRRLVLDFIRASEPMPIDPSWNRLWGLVWEGPQGDPLEAVRFWTKYLDDLEKVPGLSADERPMAQALVCNHLAELYLEGADDLSQADDLDPDYDDFDEDDDGDEVEIDILTSKQKAIEFLERSLRLAPRHRPTFELLSETYQEWKQPEKVEETYRRILDVFPDDVEALTSLASDYYDKNEPALALDYLQRARKLKPLDEELLNREISARIRLARTLALEKRWDEGRAQFAVVEQLDPARNRAFDYLARKAVFEAKAGQRDAADLYESEAAALLAEPTPLWLVLHVESIRFKLTKATQKHYAELFTKDLKKKCRSETAGAMASLLSAYLAERVDYPGREKHVRDLRAYLARTTRLKYRREDLEAVCEFLAQLPKDDGLMRKLVERGVKEHRDSAILHLMAGVLEVDKGPVRCLTHVAKHHLDKALSLAEASSRPAETRLIPMIKQVSSLISEVTSSPFDSFFSGFGGFRSSGGGPGFAMNFRDDDDFDDDDFDDDDFDDDGPWFGSDLPGPGASGRAKKPKSTRKK
jgi:tetratricopeptide (TPR) repeat protein